MQAKRKVLTGCFTTKHSLRLLALLLAVAITSAHFQSGCFPQRTKAIKLEGRKSAEIGERLLIVAPHPDDEGLAASGIIQKALAGGTDVRVLVVTCGDASPKGAFLCTGNKNPSPSDYRALGRARAFETLNAMRKLGLPPNKVIFLGYADGSTNSLWDTNWDYNRLHTGRNGSTRCPYSFAFKPGAPYCGLSLVSSLREIMNKFKPTAVLYPDEEDMHHDHWAVNAFMQYVMILEGYKGKEYTYLVHRFDFPEPQGYDPSLPLILPVALSKQEIDTRWETLPISQHEENLKRSAIKSYVIPLRIIETLIESFVRRNELLGIPRKSVARFIGDSKPHFFSKRMPLVVERDPKGDDLVFNESGCDVLKASLGVGRTFAYLGLEVVGNVRSGIKYVFRLRIFKRRGVKRLDIFVRGKNARCALLASDSVSAGEDIPVLIRGARLWIEVSSSLFRDAGVCMFSTDIMKGPHRIDHTAWRRVNLK